LSRPPTPSRRRRRHIIAHRLKKKEGEEEPYDYRAAEKADQMRIQQDLLKKRRSGSLIEEASARRQNVRKTVDARKAERKQERDALAEGRMPETLKKWNPYAEENREANSGIVVPLLPFGMRKYDEGERFDLRSPYAGACACALPSSLFCALPAAP